MFNQVDKNEMNEVMIDCFLHLEEENLEGKTNKEILYAWVSWVEARYKVAYIPEICYAIIDCEDGDLVSMINAEMPNAKQKANEMCATLNCKEEPLKEPIKEEPKLDVKSIADAYLTMDDESFIDFLLNQEREE